MQLSYNTQPAVAFAGMLADIGLREIVTRICATRKLASVVVATESNGEKFTVTIDGTKYEYTSDGSGTKAEIAAGLKAAIDAGSADVTVTLFQTSTANDSFYVEANSYDTGFTITTTDPATGRLTLTDDIVPQNQAIPFGMVVVEDERVAASASGKREACRLPRIATDITTKGKTLGVAIADTSKLTRSTSPYGGYSSGEAVPVLKKGRIWMPVEDVASVTVGGLVYVRVTAGAGEQLGAIRAADDGGDTDVLAFEQAHFTGQTIGSGSTGLAIVEWNL